MNTFVSMFCTSCQVSIFRSNEFKNHYCLNCRPTFVRFLQFGIASNIYMMSDIIPYPFIFCIDRVVAFFALSWMKSPRHFSFVDWCIVSSWTVMAGQKNWFFPQRILWQFPVPFLICVPYKCVNCCIGFYWFYSTLLYI